MDSSEWRGYADATVTDPRAAYDDLLVRRGDETVDADAFEAETEMEPIDPAGSPSAPFSTTTVACS